MDWIGEDCSGNRQNLALITATTSFNDTMDLFPPHIFEDAETYLHRAFLPPLNVHVDEFNDKILDRLPGDFQFCFGYSIERIPDYFAKRYIAVKGTLPAPHSPAAFNSNRHVGHHHIWGKFSTTGRTTSFHDSLKAFISAGSFPLGPASFFNCFRSASTNFE